MRERVRALSMVTKHIICYKGDIEVGPNSRQVYPSASFYFHRGARRMTICASYHAEVPSNIA